MNGLNKLQLFTQKLRCGDGGTGVPLPLPGGAKGDESWKGQIKGFKSLNHDDGENPTATEPYLSIDLSQDSVTGTALEPVGFLVQGTTFPSDSDSFFKANSFIHYVSFNPPENENPYVLSDFEFNSTVTTSPSVLFPSITDSLVYLDAYWDSPILYFTIEFKTSPYDLLTSGIYYAI
jgi:hypothetical protein